MFIEFPKKNIFTWKWLKQYPMDGLAALGGVGNCLCVGEIHPKKLLKL